MNRLMLVIVALLMLVSLLGCSGNGSSEGVASSTPEISDEQQAAEWTVNPLEGFPLDTVPLYKSDLLDTSYYSVRNDPQWAAVEGGLRNIYHVVYHTSAPPQEVLEYYLGLMESKTDADASDGYIEGVIGGFPVELNTTEESSYNAVYLSVDLPKSQVTEENPFFDDYPAELVETPAEFIFFEDKYYEYLYRNTDMAYWRQFDIADLNGDDIPDLSLEDVYTFYESIYSEKPEFAIDRASRQMTWKDGEYSVVMAFYEGGGRGVLEIGWDWKP